MSDQQLSTYERLSARFPTEAHKKVNKGGGDQTYVPAVDIFDRVDEVLGVTGWQARVIREGLTATEAWVLAEVTATIDGQEVVRQQYGCESITVGRDAKPVGDLFKKAATDAYKKCLTLMGVARYLYDADERREVEQEMREQARGGGKPAPKKAWSENHPTTEHEEPRRVQQQAVAAPAPLKTKAQLVDDMNRGIAMAKSLGLEPAEVDPADMDRVAIQDVIAALARQIRIVKAARAEAAS